MYSARAEAPAALPLQATSTSTPTATQASTATAAPAATVVVVTATTRGSYARPLVNMVSAENNNSRAYAGAKFTLNSTYKNQGQKTAYNIIITFTASDIQPLTNGGVAFISKLEPGDSSTIAQDFIVKSTIATYQSAITAQVDYKDEDGTAYTQKFTISVNIYWYTSATSTPTITPTPYGRPQIVVSTYSVDVPALRPGSNFNLTLNIKNFGNVGADNVILTLSSSTSGSGTTTTTNFLPVGSSNVRVLGNMASQQEMQLTQAFVVNSSINPGVYPLTLSFAYRDSKGTLMSDEQIITLLVYLVPSIDVSFYEEPGPYSVGTKGNLPIQVVNLNSTSFLLGDMEVTAEGATLANNRLFVGTIDGGGTFSMDVDITPQKTGTLPIKITITYQDNFKNIQTITRSLSVTVGGGAATPAMSGTAMPGSGQFPMQVTPGAVVAGRLTQQAAPETIWQVILRVLRGLIGFESAPSTTTTIQFPTFGSNRTATPAR